MKHLTVDEMIEFVSLAELNKEALELSAVVNGHIRKCEQCRARVRAFQTLYDEFLRLGIKMDLEKYIKEKIENENLSEKKTSIDDFR